MNEVDRGATPIHEVVLYWGTDRPEVVIQFVRLLYLNPRRTRYVSIPMFSFECSAEELTGLRDRISELLAAREAYPDGELGMVLELRPAEDVERQRSIFMAEGERDGNSD